LIELAANTLATELSSELKIDIEPVRDFSRAIQKSDVCVTCTPAKQFFVHKEDVAPGTSLPPLALTTRTNRKSIRR
jgi:ornithine cyclodeaminase/alanine dehydrogenase-like protein (mu-crystallin family)